MLLNIAIASLMMMMMIIITTFIHASGISLVIRFVQSHGKNGGNRRPLARGRAISSVVLLMFFFSFLDYQRRLLYPLCSGYIFPTRPNRILRQPEFYRK